MTTTFHASNNPFSTRYTRPGAIPYLTSFESAHALAQSEALADDLIGKLLKGDGLGAIVGPHGVGKSTLLHVLMERLTRKGFPYRAFAIDDNRHWRTMRSAHEPTFNSLVHSNRSTRRVLVIDGWERLAFWRRRLIAAVSRFRRQMLLVTSHEPCELPTLWVASVDVVLLRAIVERIEPRASRALHDGDLQALLNRRHGNVREILFELYDRFALGQFEGCEAGLDIASTITKRV